MGHGICLGDRRVWDATTANKPRFNRVMAQNPLFWYRSSDQLMEGLYVDKTFSVKRAFVEYVAYPTTAKGPASGLCAFSFFSFAGPSRYQWLEYSKASSDGR